MKILFHYPLSPFCRKIRIMLAEKGCSFDLDDENIPFKRLSNAPTEDPPVLLDDGHYIFDYEVITEYLEEKYPEIKLLGNDLYERAEIRRLCRWFDEKFYSEVSGVFIQERLKQNQKNKSPNSRLLTDARKKLTDHLFYISHLLQKNDRLNVNGALKLISGNVTMADITAAAHLSVLEYFGDINWNGLTEKNAINYVSIKDWYIAIKSRPSFRSLLTDNIKGISPSKDYSKLDF